MRGQTINVDLCFVPLTHHPEAKLPAISGSSGKLVFQSGTAVDKAPHYPGRVFEDDKLPYTSAMEGFVSASRDKDKKSTVSLPIDGKRSSVKERQRIVHEEEVALRNERRSLRQQRKKEDAAWKRAREQRRQQTMEGTKLPQTPSQAFNSQQWKQCREQRRQTVERRKQEDIQWRHKRQQIKQRWPQFPVVTAWIAILVITDNCTRQCPELGEGIVQGFRRPASHTAEARYQLRGLEPDAQYELTDFDNPEITTMAGNDLIEKGLTINIADQPGAAVVRYTELS